MAKYGTLVPTVAPVQQFCCRGISARVACAVTTVACLSLLLSMFAWVHVKPAGASIGLCVKVNGTTTLATTAATTAATACAHAVGRKCSRQADAVQQLKQKVDELPGSIKGMMHKQADDMQQQLMAAAEAAIKQLQQPTEQQALIKKHAAEDRQQQQQRQAAHGLITAVCSAACVDVLIPYHEDDYTMFVKNGVLEAAKRHLQGIRKFIIVSKSDSTFKHLLDDRTVWYDESQVPFSSETFSTRRSGRPLGWLFQQTLKFWAVEHMPGLCNNVMIMDSDVLWIRDFNVQVTAETPQGATACASKWVYNLSSMKSGAWDGDIVNPEYQHYVAYMLGMPKALKDTHTAINHWQLMQRDVVQALSRSLQARLNVSSIQEAMVNYALENNGMSEYEAYFSFAWYFYQDRLDTQHLPYVMWGPARCNYTHQDTVGMLIKNTKIAYVVCHDGLGADFEHYANCNGREADCDPKRASH